MLTLELLGGRAPGLTRVPREADGRSSRSGARVLYAHVRVDRVSVGLKSERLPDLEAASFAGQHEFARLVREDKGVPVDAHRDHFRGAAGVRCQLKPSRSKVAEDDHRPVASIPELELLELSAFAAHHGAIERRLDGDQ